MIDKKPCCQSYQFYSYSIISLFAVLSPQTITDHHHELIVIHCGYERIWNGRMNAAYPAPFLPHHPHLWGLWCERWIQGCLGFGNAAFILAMNNTPRSSTGITILGYELEVLISLLRVLSCTGLGWQGEGIRQPAAADFLQDHRAENFHHGLSQGPVPRVTWIEVSVMRSVVLECHDSSLSKMIQWLWIHCHETFDTWLRVLFSNTGNILHCFSWFMMSMNVADCKLSIHLVG